MPKAGIEPARGHAPLDFESSASTSSATSARSMRGTSYRAGVAGRAPRRHNSALTKERPSLVSQRRCPLETPSERCSPGGVPEKSVGRKRRRSEEKH